MTDEDMQELGFPTKHHALVAVSSGDVYRRSRKGWNSTSGVTHTHEQIAKRGLGRIIFEGEDE